MSIDRFYFKQFQADKDKEGKPTVVTVEDSVEFDEIRRTRQYPDGTMIIILKDGHEESREVKRPVSKKEDEVVRQRLWVQTEIRLMPDDAARFRKLTSYYNEAITYDGTTDAKVEDDNKTQEELPEPVMEQVGPDKFLN